MRGIVPGLASPHPLADTLPALYADDSFAQRLCEGLDQVLAPVLATLDCLPAYLDPATAPTDLLQWLAGWVGIMATAEMPIKQRRDLVAAAARLYVSRGTLAAISTAIELSTGQRPEISESGGTSWSAEPDGALPGMPDPGLTIRLRATDRTLDESQLGELIAAFVPAHVPWRLELLR
jgi:phage tail-like protein